MSANDAWQRLDTWLWCARVMRARQDCAALAAAGRLRVNRRLVEKAHARLRVGDVVTVPIRDEVRVLRVLALAARRGPTAEARLLYDEVAEAPDAGAPIPCEGPALPAYRAGAPTAEGCDGGLG